MATEFVFKLEHRPGALAQVAEALGSAGVNIDGLQGVPCGGEGIVHLVANDPDGAAKALNGAGIKHTTREVLLVKLEDKPGALARFARAMANAGVNIDATYVTMSGQVVMGVDKMADAHQVAHELGVM